MITPWQSVSWLFVVMFSCAYCFCCFLYVAYCIVFCLLHLCVFLCYYKESCDSVLKIAFSLDLGSWQVQQLTVFYPPCAAMPIHHACVSKRPWTQRGRAMIRPVPTASSPWALQAYSSPCLWQKIVQHCLHICSDLLIVESNFYLEKKKKIIKSGQWFMNCWDWVVKNLWSWWRPNFTWQNRFWATIYVSTVWGIKYLPRPPKIVT